MFGITAIALLGLAAPSFAQDSLGKKIEHGADKAWHGTKKGANKAWQGTKKGAKTVGNKTAELASKGASEVKDKRADQWRGPDGQVIYATDDSRYYWVDRKGKRNYVTESEMKAHNQ